MKIHWQYLPAQKHTCIYSLYLPKLSKEKQITDSSEMETNICQNFMHRLIRMR